ncbi:hypothetical protein Agub_g891 [Astrephomene gubernaculifera]|uniref:Uncharacterized protein n=1 Tax=Astrephomene gubernaculifera TaxID=47775 RepID=A0AAD3DH76_9CHLO|nr:hypothetical protein Agub_g891 [Astrephomene gubernaculifera]
MVVSAQRELFFAVRSSVAANNTSRGSDGGASGSSSGNSNATSNGLLMEVMMDAARFNSTVKVITAGGRSALSALEAAVSRSLTSRSQLQRLMQLLYDESYYGPLDSGSSSGGGLTTDDLVAARSRILGRAQSRLTWLAAHQQPICAFLRAERLATAQQQRRRS